MLETIKRLFSEEKPPEGVAFNPERYLLEQIFTAPIREETRNLVSRFPGHERDIISGVVRRLAFHVGPLPIPGTSQPLLEIALHIAEQAVTLAADLDPSDRSVLAVAGLLHPTSACLSTQAEYQERAPKPVFAPLSETFLSAAVDDNRWHLGKYTFRTVSVSPDVALAYRPLLLARVLDDKAQRYYEKRLPSLLALIGGARDHRLATVLRNACGLVRQKFNSISIQHCECEIEFKMPAEPFEELPRTEEIVARKTYAADSCAPETHVRGLTEDLRRQGAIKVNSFEGNVFASPEANLMWFTDDFFESLAEAAERFPYTETRLFGTRIAECREDKLIYSRRHLVWALCENHLLPTDFHSRFDEEVALTIVDLVGDRQRNCRATALPYAPLSIFQQSHAVVHRDESPGHKIMVKS